MKLIKVAILLILCISPIFTTERHRIKHKSSSRSHRTHLKSSTEMKSKTDDLSMNSISTQISRNYESWNQKAILYIDEYNNPISDIALKGIPFSDKFSDSKGIFVQFSNFHGKSGYYLPYRNLQRIWCNASGNNKFETSDGTQHYQFWVDLWEGNCNTLASKLESARVNRQTTLSGVATLLSNSAQSYIDNFNTYTSLNSGGGSIQTQIDAQNLAIANTKTSITTAQSSLETVTNGTNTKQSAISTLYTANSGLQATIDSNKSTILTLNENIKSLEAQGQSGATSQTQYTTLSNTALNALAAALVILNEEAPSDSARLQSAYTALQTAADETAFNTIVRAIIPA